VTQPDLPEHIRGALLRYRVMANIVGVLLIVLVLIGVPLANFDGTSMWGIFDTTPVIWTEGSQAHDVGEWITTVLGVAHGYLYMIFVLTAFLLSRRALWPIGFTLVTFLLGTVPVLSFWAEHRATARVRREWAETVGDTTAGSDVSG
jgi:integral membrane protein